MAGELEVQIIGRQKGHIWEQTELPAYCALQGRPPLLNLANSAPLLYDNNFYTLHDLAFFYHPEWNSGLFSKWYNFLVPRLLRKSVGIFTVSETVKKEIVQAYGIKPGKIQVTYNGIPTYMQKPQPDKIEKEKIILSVGSFNLRKNHQKLIEAFYASALRDTYHLIIVADRNKVFRNMHLDEEILRQAQIQILAHISEPELFLLYKRAEIVASLSHYEGFGIPLVEGLFASCKLVCSDIPVYRELFAGAATFCRQAVVTDIAEKLEQATRSPEPDNALKTNLLQLYNYERSANIIVETIRRAYH